MIIPSIDLLDGRAVQLRGGRQQLLACLKDPLELAAEFNRYGEVAVIDLDAATEKGNNLELVKKLCRVADVRAGGGIRSKERADELLRAGARKIIIGSAAQPEFLEQFPAAKIQVALDHSGGTVVDKGWSRSTGEKVVERAQRLAPYCSSYLCTFVDREGSLQGLDAAAVAELQERLPHPLTASGGISGTENALEILALGADLQVGTALYTGKLDLAAALIGTLAFEDNLLPTIVQETNGQVLMLAYSSPESLRLALLGGKGIYYSRSRREIWEKGLTSGNSQDLVSCRADCDSDALLFTVRQNGPTCHTGSYSCFGSCRFNLHTLYDLLARRRDNPPARSYTARLLSDPAYLKSKIMEEAREVVSSGDRGNLVWEIADLTYFLSVLAVKNGLSWQEITAELGGRNKDK